MSFIDIETIQYKCGSMSCLGLTFPILRWRARRVSWKGTGTSPQIKAPTNSMRQQICTYSLLGYLRTPNSVRYLTVGYSKQSMASSENSIYNHRASTQFYKSVPLAKIKCKSHLPILPTFTYLPYHQKFHFIDKLPISPTI